MTRLLNFPILRAEDYKDLLVQEIEKKVVAKKSQEFLAQVKAKDLREKFERSQISYIKAIKSEKIIALNNKQKEFMLKVIEDWNNAELKRRRICFEKYFYSRILLKNKNL